MADIVDGTHRYLHNDFKVDDFLNRSLVISGQSGTGKSFVLNSILTSLAPHVGRMYGFSATAYADEGFPFSKYTFPELIRTNLDVKLMHQVHTYLIEFKKKLGKIKEISSIQKYAKATMVYLYTAQPKLSKSAKEIIDKLKIRIQKAKAIKIKLNSREGQNMIKDERDQILKKLTDIYTNVVVQGCRILLERFGKISNPKLKEAYDSLIFNPKTVIVINDLTSDMGKLKNPDFGYFQDLLDHGRHSWITVIILLHDWACMKKELRNAIHNHIFTSIEMVNNFISIQRYQGSASKKLHRAAEAIIQRDRALPPGKRKFSMMFWMRLTDKIEYVIADAKGKQIPVGIKYYYELSLKKQKREEEDPF